MIEVVDYDCREVACVSRRNPRVRNVCCATKSESMRNLVSYIPGALIHGGLMTQNKINQESYRKFSCLIRELAQVAFLYNQSGS